MTSSENNPNLSQQQIQRSLQEKEVLLK